MIVWFSWMFSIFRVKFTENTGLPVIYSVLKTLTGSRAEKFPVSQNMVSSSEPSVNHRLEIYKAFQDRLTFLNRHDNLEFFDFVKFTYGTAGDLVF